MTPKKLQLALWMAGLSLTIGQCKLILEVQGCYKKKKGKYSMKDGAKIQQANRPDQIYTKVDISEYPTLA